MKPKVVDMDLADYTQVLEEAEDVIRQCFTQYKIEEVFLSFNGGKDCTVLLDITLNVLRQLYNREDLAKELKVVYIRTNDPFQEIETFVKEVEKHYGVTLIVTEGELRATLQRLLEQDERLKACLMGTRRTDPYSAELNFMQKTDPSWPQLVRVSPLLNWSYHQIWSYVLKRNVPYCTLYNQGYTSIGSVYNTQPNPALAYKSHCGRPAYLPAWRLTDASLERAGRGTKLSTANTNAHTYDSSINNTTNGHDTYNSSSNNTTNGHDTYNSSSNNTINGHDICNSSSNNTTNGHIAFNSSSDNTSNGHAEYNCIDNCITRDAL